MLWKCCTQYTSKFGKLSSGQDWKRSVFIPIPKKGNAKEYSNYHTNALISHASKVMLKMLRLGFNSMWTVNFQMFKLDLEKAKEQEIKLPPSVGSSKMREISRKTSTSAFWLRQSLWLSSLITTYWKILQEMGVPDHFICVLRKVYAGQEATIRTGHGAIERFLIGKGVHQGCILSPCLFNL